MKLIRAMKSIFLPINHNGVTDPRKFQPALPLPIGYSRERLLAALEPASIDGSALGEMAAYVQADIERFIHTLSLAPENIRGKALEIGANPYFMTLLFRKFRPDLEFTLVNYFGGDTHEAVQHVSFPGFDHDPQDIGLAYHNANLELTALPFEENSFDLVLFCEVLEHLTVDPLHAMQELKRVLKPGGRLVLTTPNAARLENVSAFVEGRNIYDPYSKYGPYGRHNREYTRHELSLLLTHCGFEIETFYTANVHDDIAVNAQHAAAISAIINGIPNRKYDLGQYLFTSSINRRKADVGRPSWLFRSYPPEEMSS
jgi:SAM-dependent methyltransferase